MASVAGRPEVLTLREAAKYLRLPEESVRELIVRRGLPARQIGEDWRLLRAAVDEWLRHPDVERKLIRRAGADADGET